MPIELHPLQQPHPPLWYPGNVETAAKRGFNTIIGGPIPAVARGVVRYREVYEAHDGAHRGVNAAFGPPVVGGATRVFIAATDAEAQARARARGRPTPTTSPCCGNEQVLNPPRCRWIHRPGATSTGRWRSGQLWSARPSGWRITWPASKPKAAPIC